MQIILDQGIFDMRNLGQNALLQAAIERVRKSYPESSIGVTTFAPYLLKIFFPGVFPVSPDGSHVWHKNRNNYNRIHQFIPVIFLKILLGAREELWYRWPGFSPGTIREKLKSWVRQNPTNIEVTDDSSEDTVSNANAGAPDYSSVVSDADLFIATGSQYLCDHARDTAFQVLGRLEAATQRGIPTAMVGQGIGPIDDFELRAKAKQVLPLLDLILVRERLEAPEILASLGVDPTKIIVTGDDAIELAYSARASFLGYGIGVSMRCRPSTRVDNSDLSTIGEILRETAQKHDAELVGLPISRSLHERDDICTQQIMEGHDKIWMSRKKFQTPLAYIRSAQRCRLVIAGTFHGAVLALAQGIPVVCLVRSSLYTNKFKGLADLFNPGCEIVSLDDEFFRKKLISSIELTWQSAENLRTHLLEKAVQQIEWGQSGYQQLFDMVNSKKKLYDDSEV